MRIAIAILALAACAALAVFYGAWRWTRATETLLDKLFAARVPIAPATYHSAQELAQLPSPVQRYFRAALREGQPIVAMARFTHTGTFNTSETTPSWRAFTSSQAVATRRPGFVWNARVGMAPGIAARVHDAYIAGEGMLRAAIFGLVTVADAHGTPVMAEGELLRYLAEAIWYPTALLPSQGVSWTPIDERSARATLSDGATTVSLKFQFRDDGLIESAYTPSRGRMKGGRVMRVPWRTRAWSYDVRDGMRVPLEAEVAWLQEDGAYPYWRGRIRGIAYEYAP